MSHADPPQVAGLRLRWHEFRHPDPGAFRPQEPHPAAPGDAGASGTTATDDRSFGLWVLEDPDVLLDLITPEEYEANDERMPYFGAVWPSAESLVAKLLAGPRLDGVELLDLGCGLGPCGFAAAARGARVTFMDWEPRALEIVERSVLAQGRRLADFDLVVADWRKPPRMGPFDLVIGADVLYEERNAPAVAAFLGGHVKPGGEAWIGDPGRPHAIRFPALAQQHGLAFKGSERLPAMKHAIEIALQRYARE
ncbi:MAG: class I SAM-dependent methyltransferase [Planctomycetes bacterium]|nr:class I SAM-dependent methyltransferase [Planctomycetota bacterium]